ncbi:uncharacterized protein F4807DRAFT_405320 [Annulohypoxylon truncatum]|uniref:uncharacterized protein n=1 Tax=Annulohypoxylon truncatum TaxID=327061 RepID=UPI0020079793|nr:uncharacterized protein F4807DRAFT_405320 [Annulohypoxylon truncatum]KAI1214977.1 hypothetical protein F4807DRAFT_405320 [Annulohypoxylon truncatum]
MQAQKCIVASTYLGNLSIVPVRNSFFSGWTGAFRPRSPFPLPQSCCPNLSDAHLHPIRATESRELTRPEGRRKFFWWSNGAPFNPSATLCITCTTTILTLLLLGLPAAATKQKFAPQTIQRHLIQRRHFGHQNNHLNTLISSFKFDFSSSHDINF